MALASAWIRAPLRRGRRHLRRRRLHTSHADAVVCGGGIAGCAAAYHLALRGAGRVVVVSAHAPLTLTSAMSTECYRDFWPSPEMAGLMGRSIDLMEGLARDTDNAIGMTRRGYAYFTKDAATLAKVEATCAALAAADAAGMPSPGAARAPRAYEFGDAGPLSAAALAAGGGPRGSTSSWATTRCGARSPPSAATSSARSRRGAGWAGRAAVRRGARRRRPGARGGIRHGRGPGRRLRGRARRRGALRGRRRGARRRGPAGGRADDAAATPRFVNAAGPCLNAVHGLLPGRDAMAPEVARALGVDAPGDGRRLPLRNHLHAKVVFRDAAGAVPRDAPMMISLDPQTIWPVDDDDERAALAEAFGEAAAAKLTGTAGPGVHLRPYAHDALLLLWEHWHGDWAVAEPPDLHPAFDADLFPEVCLRGLASFIPALGAAVDDPGDRPVVDGGYYTETPELVPLLGPVPGARGAFLCGGLAGYGLMAAHAAGELVAAHALGDELPWYAPAMAPARYADPAYADTVRRIAEAGDGGI
ncbi:FAD dependent oxidoreductase [Aureococcus anophagefferens]|uniref:FAD-dependent oxidoreductase domain-containing protein 1 n=1 Tax=Aureococcus anophagefferens TaxID=44056 RepID=A0ABR1GG27_AURAN